MLVRNDTKSHWDKDVETETDQEEDMVKDSHNEMKTIGRQRRRNREKPPWSQRRPRKWMQMHKGFERESAMERG